MKKLLMYGILGLIGQGLCDVGAILKYMDGPVTTAKLAAKGTAKAAKAVYKAVK